MDTTNEDQQTNPTSTDEVANTIKVTIRTATCQQTLEVEDEIPITDLRAKVSELFTLEDKAQAVLIFGGKILKDHENVKSVGIKDGQTIHLVIRRNQTGDSNTPTNRAGANLTSQNSANTNSSNTDNNNSQRANLMAGNPMLGNLSEIQQRLQQMLINDPEATQNMASMLNPTMQQIMTNPEMMRSLFGGMQRMQSIIESNPEVNRLLSNPELLRESLEMVRNPAALQEVMRNYDRALNNMESMPGGFNALRRIYTEFQEPLMNAFQDSNQFNSPTTNSDENSSDSPLRTENRDPLPNPWAPNNNASQQPPFSARAAAAAAAGAGAGSNPANWAQDQNLSNTLGGNVSQTDALRQNQELMQLMTNPEFTRIIEQITSGFESLQRLAPNLFGRLGIPGIPSLMSAAAGNSPGSVPNQTGGNPNFDFNSMIRMSRELLDRQPDANTNSSNSGINQQQQSDAARMLAQLMSQAGGLGDAQQPLSGSILGSGATAAEADNNQPPPEVRYSQQLQQLSEMGFTNREANIRALTESLGDINSAIARLLPQ